MSDVRKPETEFKDLDSRDILTIDAEVVDEPAEQQINSPAEEITKISVRREKLNKSEGNPTTSTKKQVQYLILPLIFLTVTLLGGLRVGSEQDDFIFQKPSLICLVFAMFLLVLFFRARLLRTEGWFSENYTMLKNTANFSVLLTLFAASSQIFNSLLPEQGLLYWIVAFFFFWSLWTNLFADFNPKKLLTSLAGLFGLAFVTKYLILVNFTVAKGNWLERLFENPASESIAYLLDLPRFAPATGYIQFFAVIFYLAGLFLLSPASVGEKD